MKIALSLWQKLAGFGLLLCLFQAIPDQVVSGKGGRATIIHLVPTQTTAVAPDRVRLSVSSKRLKISISHVRGIGKLTVKRESGRWPKRIELLFFGFGALEGLSLQYAGKTENLHVTQSNVSKSKNLRIRRTAAGIFLSMPGDALDDRDNTLQLSWVDYYR